MEPIVTVKDVSKVYKNGRGIKRLSFQIEKGDVFGFFGPNGSGKTTLMKLMTGLIRPDEGEITILGETVTGHSLDGIGSLIETVNAYEYMSAYRNLKLSSRFYKDLPKSRIDEVLELVELTPYKNELVKGFSLGMKQRLGLASALLSKPQLIILDEPTNGLDIEGMASTRQLIINLAKEQNMTFFISSHLVSEMEQMCNQMAIIYNGSLIEKGSLKELVKKGITLEKFYLSSINKAKRIDVNE
jgi:ABC-2 type transport system ATP-binding protein